jgi:UPF0716 protein FxsA
MLNNLLARFERSDVMSPLRFAMMLLFLGFPLLEITVLIIVGQMIGFWPTFGLLVLSATAGMLIIRDQGVSMVGRMFETMSRGGLAVATMVDGYAVILAGCLLILPGFISDALGIALLVPRLRRVILGAVLPGFADARREDKSTRPQTGRTSEPHQPIIIEGTYQRIDEDDPKT